MTRSALRRLAHVTGSEENTLRIIKSHTRRGTFWSVDGVASCASVEAAVDLAIDALREVMAVKPACTLWTEHS